MVLPEFPKCLRNSKGLSACHSCVCYYNTISFFFLSIFCHEDRPLLVSNCPEIFLFFVTDKIHWIWYTESNANCCFRYSIFHDQLYHLCFYGRRKQMLRWEWLRRMTGKAFDNVSISLFFTIFYYFFNIENSGAVYIFIAMLSFFIHNFVWACTI